MADKPKSSIPEWQKSNAGSERSSTGTTATTTNPSADDNDTEERPALLDQAAKFLQDDSIRDAPVERKRTFLESKGLRNDEIDLLLSQSPEESSTSEEPSSNPEVANNHEAPSSSSSASTPHSSPSSTATTATSTSPTPPPLRDIPPIITYPEFLTTPATQPPLITLRSTLYTLYGAAGLATTFYAASEYLVKPMIAQLTAARRDLAETTTTNLRTLNTKLESVVSTIPPPPSSTNAPANPEGGADDEDTESIISDPTELFHRDVAVQTSPSPSPNPQLEPTQPSLITATTNEDPTPLAKARTHTARMHTLTAHLRSLTDTDHAASELDTALRAKLNDLHHYLDTYIYSKPGAGAMFNPMAGYGVFSTPGVDATNTSGTNGNGGLGLGKGEEDAIANFRTEIRGVKGALLSARNFPAGGGGSRG
ncbi:peroxisomal membrane protein PEX14, partial [Aspergillus fijiensis CBS 313.89]